jgi:hypothetical protein
VSSERKQVLLRIDPAVHDALARWASDELRSLNAQIEMLLRHALGAADPRNRSGRQEAPLPPALGRSPDNAPQTARLTTEGL